MLTRQNRYFSGEEVLACDQAGITAYVPKPLTSGAKADGRFGKQDFVYMPDRDEYRCPAGHAMTRRFETVDKGMIINVYATPACRGCLLKADWGRLRKRKIEHAKPIESVEAA